MKNSTKIRLHLSKNLFESLAAEVLAEAKKDMSGGAYTEAVKAPKEKKEKAPEVEKTDKMKEEGVVKEMETKVAEKKDKSLEELKAVHEKLSKKIEEMESAPALNEDATQVVMDFIQKVPEMYDLLRAKAQMAPHEFDILMSGIATLAGLGVGVGKAVAKDLKSKFAAKKSADSTKAVGEQEEE